MKNFSPSLENIQSPNTEEIILYCLLSRHANYQKILDTLTKDDFVDIFHKCLFDCVCRCNDENKDFDLATISEKYLSSKYKEITGKSLAEITSILQKFGICHCDIDTNIKILKSISLRRKIITILLSQASKFLDNMPSEDVENSLNALQREISSISSDITRGDYVEYKDAINDFKETMVEDKKYFDEHNTKPNHGLSVNCKALDYFLDGIQPTQLIILAARPGVGKTALALNIASQVARSNHPVAFFSFEMGCRELVSRLVSIDTNVAIERLVGGAFSSVDLQRVEDLKGRASPIFIFDAVGENKISEIKQKCRALQGTRGLELIIIDYLGLLSSATSYDNKYLETSELSRDLKCMASDLKIPVLCLAQLSRAPEKRAGGEIFLSDLRDSGSIEQDADVVILMKTEAEHLASGDSAVCIDVAKNRRGKIGKLSLRFQKNTQILIGGENDPDATG